MSDTDQRAAPLSRPAPRDARPERADAAAPAGWSARPRSRGDRVRAALALPEVRWALVSLGFFVLAAPAWFLGAPTWVTAPLFAACYLTGGWQPALAGLQALRERTLDVDLLMIVAALGAAAIGQVFDGALLIVIFATSGALEAWATARTESSVRGLLELSPDRATRLDPVDGSESDVAAGDLAVGDVVLVRPGELVGADGSVVGGASEVDQASITGEPLPAPKTTGDEVYAGTVNGTGVLRVRVTRESGDWVIARIATLVEQASETKARTQRFIEKVEQRYSVGVVVATLAIFAVPLWWGADLASALLRAMTFMIVASPCAIVLSTMPPLLAAVANAGRHGVLVRNAQVMEDLAAVGVVALDKTGTLTRGRPELSAIHLLPAGDADTTGAGGWTRDGVLAVAAAAEYPSEHPLARAVVSAARDRDLEIAEAEDFVAAPGRGVRAVVGGCLVEVTSPTALPDPGDAADGPPATDHRRRAIQGIERDGHTAVVVTADGTPVAVLAISDTLRPAVAGTVAALREHTGSPPVLLTGDNPRTAAAVATRAGIGDVRAELLPQDKVGAVTGLRERHGRVLMVGDGINDAPALAAADVGVGMGGAGADLTLQAADVVVVRDELDTLPALLHLARRARRIVVANLVVAGSIIAALVVWDLVGTLPLPLAVAGHEGSTVLVALNGLRLLRRSAWITPDHATGRAGHTGGFPEIT